MSGSSIEAVADLLVMKRETSRQRGWNALANQSTDHTRWMSSTPAVIGWRIPPRYAGHIADKYPKCLISLSFRSIPLQQRP